MKARAETCGCTLNFGEAREIEDLLAAGGWPLCESHGGCDLVVIAACIVAETTGGATHRRIEEMSKSPRLVVKSLVARAYRDNPGRLAPDAEFAAPGDIELPSAAVGPDTLPTYLVGTLKGVA